MRMLRAIAVWLLVSVAAVAAVAQQAKPEQAEAVTWQSLLCVDGTCKPMDAKGFLFATPAAKSVVMISHGSQGIDSRMYDYVDALAKEGFAALVIDHWTPRGIGVTHEDYAAAGRKGGNEYNMAADSLTAAEWLRNVRGYAKVGSIGESQGGGAAVMLQQQFAHKAVEASVRGRWNKPGFRVTPVDAVVGMYPWCGQRFAQRDAYVGTPFLFITGAMDDETPSRYCERHVGWMNERGGKASIVVLPGVGHSFDAPYTYRRSYGPHYANCDLLIDENGILELNSGERTPGRDTAAVMAKCVSRGYSTGNRGDRFVAVPHWIRFFKQHL
jgi:dienelactone hydrolase